ncbi:MAG: 4'-phosphopantetheinyl transferase superfamily protein [Bacteroidota bacterium]
MEKILTNDELHRSSRYFRDHDRHRFTLSRGLLRLVLSQYLGIPAQSIRFAIGANKKPFIEGAATTHFNVSHAGDWALIAIASYPVGIDVEAIDEAYNYNEILDHCFSETEVQSLAVSAEPRMQFYTSWTRKEALLKATEKGIDDDLAFVPSLDGAHIVSPGKIGSAHDWNVLSFPPATGYAAAVAAPAFVDAVLFFEGMNILEAYSAAATTA